MRQFCARKSTGTDAVAHFFSEFWRSGLPVDYRAERELFLPRHLDRIGKSEPAEMARKYVTSDHRVAGSSPAGCKPSSRADLRATQTLENSVNLRFGSH